MPRSKFLAILMFPLFLLGCFQTETVVHVKPDGSGIIEETLLLSRATLESMQSMGKELKTIISDSDTKDKSGIEDPLEGMMRDAQTKAGQYGTGVRFLSAVRITTETMGGYKARYAFDDINFITISQKPDNKADISNKEKTPKPSKDELIYFKMVKGPVSNLTVTLPDPKAEKEDRQEKEKEPAPKQADPQADEMMKALFKEMRIKVSIVIEGTIIKTNATHLNKSELTLLEMNFGKLLEDPKAFDKISSAQPKTVEEMRELAKGIEGLKVELNNPVLVDFK
jgi:hypothetical protein